MPIAVPIVGGIAGFGLFLGVKKFINKGKKQEELKQYLVKELDKLAKYFPKDAETAKKDVEKLSKTEELEQALISIRSIFKQIIIVALCKHIIYADGVEDSDEVQKMLDFFQSAKHAKIFYDAIDVKRNTIEAICKDIKECFPEEKHLGILQLLQNIMNAHKPSQESILKSIKVIFGGSKHHKNELEAYNKAESLLKN